MRFATIFIFCSFIFSCSLKNEPRTESVFPVTASTVEPQKTVSTDLGCQNVTGILGFADMSYDATTVIYFYAKPNASEKPAQTLRFYDDTTINSFSFRAEGEKSYSLLNPERHKLDYSMFDLAVKNRRNGWLEVKVDEQTNGTLWLQENNNVEFEDWRQLMKEAFAISRLNTETNPLRTKPDANAKALKTTERDCFKFEQMQGDWIKVSQKTHCDTDLRSRASGWVRWRDENGCLLVEIFPFA
ncbi:MAG TPA: hypothetical protein VF571_07615 [Pyrinomonadaceae bacterium]|jgi:hypothetical protein